MLAPGGGWVSCSLGSLEFSKAHIWHGNVFSTRHSVDSLLRSCGQDVRAGAHPESAEAAQLEEVGRRARRRAAPRRGGKLRVMHTSHKRKRACLPETPRLVPGWRRAGHWWKLGARARVLLGSGDAFDEGRSQGVLAARDHDCARLRASASAQPACSGAPLTAHPAGAWELGSSKHARFTVSSASAHVLMAARGRQDLPECIATWCHAAQLQVPRRLGSWAAPKHQPTAAYSLPRAQVWALRLGMRMGSQRLFGIFSKIRWEEPQSPPSKITQETDLIQRRRRDHPFSIFPSLGDSDCRSTGFAHSRVSVSKTMFSSDPVIHVQVP